MLSVVTNVDSRLSDDLQSGYVGFLWHLQEGFCI